MRVCKCGGAYIINVCNILKVLGHTEYNSTIFVISDMGNLTYSLESSIQAYFQKGDIYKKILDRIKKIKKFLKNLNFFLFKNISPKILSLYLNYTKNTYIWINIINYLKTNFNNREGTVDWKFIQKQFKNFDIFKICLTQDFLISDSNYFINVIREVSNSSYPIITYYLNSKGDTCWKNVSEISHGDSNYIKNTQLLKSFSYKEVIDISFFGTSLLPLKNILPLHKGVILLIIHFLLGLENYGTNIMKGAKGDSNVFCTIQKLNVHLPTISSVDFTYNQKDTLYIIFKQFIELNINISIIRIFAFSVSLIIEVQFNSTNIFLNILINSFNVTLEEFVRLLYYNK